MRRCCPQKRTGRKRASKRLADEKNGRSTHARAVLLFPVGLVIVLYVLRQIFQVKPEAVE